MVLNYSNNKEVFKLNNLQDIYTLSFNKLDAIPFVVNRFSTRLGGISEGEFTSMNLSFARGDKHLSVHENFKRMVGIMGGTPGDIIFCKQTHTNKVIPVDESHKGRVSGFYEKCMNHDDIAHDHTVENVSQVYAFEEIDGMVTNTPGVCLFTSYADCVPLYFVDPVKKAIGLSHSGWRGTVGKIGAVTIDTMIREFGSNPSDIIVAIGPCICQSCYEVSGDVVEEFLNSKTTCGSEESCPTEVNDLTLSIPGKWSPDMVDSFVESKANGKYQLDLRKANELIFLEAGILPENITITNVCTACNHEVLFSHRVSKGKRGNLGAFLMIK